MRLVDYDIIKVHQTTKDFTIWYRKSIDAIAKYIPYDDAKRLMQYSLIIAINEAVVLDLNELEASKSNLHDLYEALFRSLSEDEYLQTLERFENNTDDYQIFIHQYKLDRFAKIGETGSFWLKTIDSMYDFADKQLEFLDDIVPFISWTYTYAFEYANQYLTADVYNIKYNQDVRHPYNYWELKEQEHALDIFPDKQEKDEYIYHNREELLYDLVEHGVFLPAAKKITHRIRTGRGLDEEQKELLAASKYEKMNEINEIKYLPSIAGVFSKVFRVNKLI